MLRMTASYDFKQRQNPDLSWHRAERQARGRQSSDLSTMGGRVPRTRLGLPSKRLIETATADVWRSFMTLLMESRGMKPLRLKGATEASCFEANVWRMGRGPDGELTTEFEG